MSPVNSTGTGRIAKEIIELKFGDRMTIGQAKKKFFEIMRRHGIKKGTPSEGGNSVIGDNFDWTAFKLLFLDRLSSEIEWSMFINVPRDLSGFPPKPRKKK